ncbi:hypothetical protein LTR62_004461 [Meristemomyces frigidus]|uniref:HECT-type E3 ubiquitin transferase n=1 Tax=Meristemomyces frigidus TaxID=1508187 RepID=A0AAN7THR0_9PEZI|nr:hypothetical protein LTR62_004461 [Meristemomyces frigidus]
MGRIKKVANERHLATSSPFIDKYVKEATSTPLQQLPQKLTQFPQQWPFPRGDLYHWIPLLNRFDHILELFVTEYDLHDGPQCQPFRCRLLQKGDAEEDMPYPVRESTTAVISELVDLGYGDDGDRELVESVVFFSRLLHEHCGNRSLYASSGHINDLLNTTSLSLLRLSLKLALRLAQRYQVARYKNAGNHNSSKLLMEHYNINLDNLQKIALPFAKLSAAAGHLLATPGKGKEKASQAQPFNPNDLVAIAKEPGTLALKGDLGSVNITYYEQSAANSKPGSAPPATEASPSTPTPSRRMSNLGPSRDRPSTGDRIFSSTDDAVTPSRSRETETSTSTSPKTFTIASSRISETEDWLLVQQVIPDVPTDMRYDLLNRIRVAKVFASSNGTTQQLLEIRLLAIANLSYALGESKFQEKIGQPDNEEPRRFHLAQQLADLLQPAASGQVGLSLELETVVIHTVEALLRCRHKAQEVIDSLSITVAHGVLYYELRRVIANLALHEHSDARQELRELEWREATFDLVHNLQVQQAQARVGERLVNAGIMAIMVEILSLRTTRAERFKERVLSFFASFIHNLTNAMQVFANDKGFDILAELTQHEVETALQAARSGHGLPRAHKAKVIDYEIPFYQQSTLRQLLKFVVGMFDVHSAGGTERLLRNFVDTPQVLSSLKLIIENWKIFGSNVWTSGVNIMSAFIHNEPTSYQVVGEAGLPKIFLETITEQQLPADIPADVVTTKQDLPGNIEFVDNVPQWPSIAGILPVEQTMSDVPGAFGAICLNESGMALFQASKVLIKYFDIFVSPPHVKALVEDDPLGNSGAANIGQAFDELARHQPRLKDLINMCVLSMVQRVAALSYNMAIHRANGAKLWRRTADGFEIEGGQAAIAGGPLDHDETSLQTTETPSLAKTGDLEDAEKAEALRFTTACIKFLEGYFGNVNMCSLFCESGGAEYVLAMLTSPSNPVELGTFAMYKSFSNVLKIMCESKSHLVLPSLLKRLENSLLGCKPILNTPKSDKVSIFTPFIMVDAGTTETPTFAQTTEMSTNGTSVLKALSNTQVLTDMLGKVLAPPSYTSRHSVQSNQLFANMNFTDVYLQFVERLTVLRSHCLWENLALESEISAELKEKTNPQPHKVRRVDVNGRIELTSYNSAEQASNAGTEEKGQRTPEEYEAKNISQLRHVLVELVSAVSKFEQHLAQALTPRRNNEVAMRQHALLVASKLATCAIQSLKFCKYEKLEGSAKLKYQAGLIQMLARMMLKQPFNMPGEPKEALTLVLNKFYIAKGFEMLNGLLATFAEQLADTNPFDNDGEGKKKASIYGLNAVLDFYCQVVRQKTINEANQSQGSRSRHPTHADYFQPHQLVVEIRNEVLSSVSELWHSNAIERLGDACVKKIIEILRQVVKADGEENAVRRQEPPHTRREAVNQIEFRLTNTDNAALVAAAVAVDPRLAREAVYRCNNDTTRSREYAGMHSEIPTTPRWPIPVGEPEEGAEAMETDAAVSRDAAMSDESADQGSEARDSDSTVDPPDSDDENMGTLGVPLNMTDSDLSRQMMDLIGTSENLRDVLSLQGHGDGLLPPPPQPEPAVTTTDTRETFVTVEDLNEKREAFKNTLINRCLEVLSAAPGVTFELCDLIQASVAKGAEQRAEIASTLVLSLMSLMSEDPTKEEGVKLAAYAHLVALILQDRDFFDATLDELKDSLETLLGWVQLKPEQKIEDAPWLEMVLLVLERMLSEDEQPVEMRWDPPPADDPLRPLAEPTLPTPVVPEEARSTLFEALIDVLPKIGKNESLALSVTRVLVMLTRRREVALRLSQKHNMNKLFLMIRQLSGRGDEKLYSNLMLILRHMVEDKAALCQIMQTEIRAVFEAGRSARAMDTSTFTRTMYHLVLRDPKLFVEVTGELLEIARFDGNPNRAQTLVLKKTNPVAQSEENSVEVASEEAKPADTGNDGSGVQPSVEAAVAEEKPVEPKAPTVESPDGVMAFLLRELSNYRDVEDRPAPLAIKDSRPEAQANGEASADVDMTDASISSTPNGTTNGTAGQVQIEKTNDKPVFKAEEHPIYIYRCFLLECLSELLSSYNRTKVEFINFSRKPETQPATPVKARAGTLHYLLNQLVPAGTLEHKDDISHRKRLATSHWATSLLVAVTAKTPERSKPRSIEPDTEENADLLFVRKFVLEHTLRAFKEANTSTEPLDQRYSRLLALGELFNRMLNKSDRDVSTSDPGHRQQLGRLMYEKGYVGALTSAIAELDLNFPNAKRAVKYILNPLRQLTDLGVELSQTSDLSSSSAQGGSTEEDEDETSSDTTSDDEDDREQTPDLLRNTTLGMLESGAAHDEDSSEEDDEDDDDEMEDYDDYEEMEGMEYDEEEPEHGDVVSDEDDDDGTGMGPIEGRPGDIEIVMEGEEDDEDDDDELEPDELDDDDEEHFHEHMDEITGDDENESMAEGDEGEWEEDDDMDAFEAEADEDGSPHGGPLEHLTQVLAGDHDDMHSELGEDHDHIVRVDVGDGPDEYFEDEMPPEDEDEEDEEIDYDGEVAFEPEVEDEEDDDIWGLDGGQTAVLRSGHHHHGHAGGLRTFGGMMEMLGGGADGFRAPGVRSHRPAGQQAGDDGRNPLLNRGSTNIGQHNEDGADNPLARLGNRHGVRAFPPVNLIQDLVDSVGANGHGTISVNIGEMARLQGLQGMFNIHGAPGRRVLDIDPSRPWHEQGGRYGEMAAMRALNDGHRAMGSDEARAVDFQIHTTISRWQEEARMLFAGKHQEKATRVNGSLLRVLVPPAMKAKLEHDKSERERREAEERSREEERKKAEAEKVEREEKEKKEREEEAQRLRQEEAQRLAEDSRLADEASDEIAAEMEAAAMEGIERTPPEGHTVHDRETVAGQQSESQSTPAAAAPPAEPERPVQRVMTTIRGREVDITSLGIDRDFLEAIPEEMREEVIMAQLQEQRTQAAQTGEQPTEISREFLDALPREIQQELIRQEASDRRRRERQEQRQRAVQEGGAQPAQPEEMNNADFMAMLDPGLRQTILMDTDEATIATLPEEVQAEARALLGNRLPARITGGLAGAGPAGLAASEERWRRIERQASEFRAMKTQRRPTVQMLDKAGIATLLRLMFVSLHHKAKTNLYSILSDVCKNTQNRAEVISILLSILQDGTADVGAVERSFAQLSLKAKQQTGSKTPQPVKRTPTGLVAAPTTELSPLNIVQHCLTTLRTLSEDNTKVPSFFLTEHETAATPKMKTPKKGKGRESKANKYPLNALLALLDRKLITENTGVMETLATLLSRVTQPLTILSRRAREAVTASVPPPPETEPPASQPVIAQLLASGSGDVAMQEASAPAADANVEPSASETKPADATQSAKPQNDKKSRELTPPEVPDENIRLVVNILAARECPSKTFSDTLDIIKNLSAIPGAKAVFGRELVRQAQELGQTVLADLQQLSKQISSADESTDLQGLALANFSFAGSKQRMLLRVLLALDHLFDPARMPPSSSDALVDPKLKDDVLALLYDNETFDKLWKDLSACLEAIRARGSMLNVATILLPLIESLFVVCRNSTLKNSPSSAAVTSPVDARVSTPQPESPMDTLFFRFTEDNRKILNELIRSNPKLMSGNLAILAKNSKVLEFDNKRTYFSRKLHNRGEARVPHASLQLNVRREQVFLDSFKNLNHKRPEEIKYGKLNIRFHGEEGIDAGGVSREWFGAMARQMFNPDYALFTPVASDRTTFHPNELSGINNEHLLFFKFIGRIIGKALYNGQVLDCHFSRAVYRRILGKSVSLKDMESLDLEYYKSLVWLLENDITDIAFQTFSIDVDRFGLSETVDLVEDGRNISVTEDNKQEYVQKIVEYRLITAVQEQLDHFLAGFHDIIPQELIAIFNEQELELLISGLPEIDVEDWKNNTEYHNYQSTSPQIQWFWRAVRSFDKEEKAKLLQFVTGTSKVPLNGFKELEGMNGFAKFNIHRDYSSKEKLPSSHTCFNQLDLPEYETYEHMRQQMYTAITAGSEYFGFA